MKSVNQFNTEKNVAMSSGYTASILSFEACVIGLVREELLTIKSLILVPQHISVYENLSCIKIFIRTKTTHSSIQLSRAYQFSSSQISFKENYG